MAQIQNAPSANSQGLDIAARSVAALTGGLEIKDVTLRGLATWNGRDSGAVKLMALGNGESRMDLSLPNGTRTEIRDATANVALPGGAMAMYSGGLLNYFRHSDWLGNSRLATTWYHAAYSKTAYAPFGDTYDEAGTRDRSFTGQDHQDSGGDYDFLFRKYDSIAGRWL